jgi:hypothetical protein
MSCDLPASFYRAEAAWLSPPENPPEYDEWLDAQEEKKDLMKKAEGIIGDLPSQDVDSWDELDEAIGIIEGVLVRLTPIREELGQLCDDFPDHEPDPDLDYDDSWFGV